MPDPWGDLGDFLSRIMNTTTQSISLTPRQQGGVNNVPTPAVPQTAPAMATDPAASTPTSSGGGFMSDVTDMLAAREGGIIPGLIRAHQARQQRAQLMNVMQSDPRLAPYASYVSAGAPLGDVVSLYKTEHPETKPSLFEEFQQNPEAFKAYGQALHPEAAPMMQLRQQAQKSLDQYRASTLAQGRQAHADTEADRALQRRLVAGNEAANRDLRRDFMNTGTPVSPHDLVPNPKDPTGNSSILIERDRTGRISQRVVNMPPPPGKAGQRSGASADDINRGLDQMDKSVSLLGKNPGASAVVGGLVRHGMSLAGYPAEAEFQGQAAALSDMIPKALAGRSSQSAINNAMTYMVPSFHDTQASAQRKLKNLRALFIRAGVLPKGGVSPGGLPSTLGATSLAPAVSSPGADVSDDDLLGSYRK